jgi:hypothetical protein
LVVLSLGGIILKVNVKETGYDDIGQIQLAVMNLRVL